MSTPANIDFRVFEGEVIDLEQSWRVGARPSPPGLRAAGRGTRHPALEHAAAPGEFLEGLEQPAIAAEAADTVVRVVSEDLNPGRRGGPRSGVGQDGHGRRRRCHDVITGGPALARRGAPGTYSAGGSRGRHDRGAGAEGSPGAPADA